MSKTDENYLQKLFINEAKPALNRHSGGGADYDDGYAKGKTDGIEEGKKSEHGTFWDAFQNKGGRANYYYAFAYGRFTDANYYPKYPILTSGGTTTSRYMFYETPITDTKVEIITNSNNIDHCFNGASDLVTIRKLTVLATTSFNSVFTSCSSLTNLTMGGTIGKNGLNLQWSTKLTHESLRSIIDCLEDKSTDTSGTAWVVTVGSENLAKLTDDDLTEIHTKGWEFK